MFIFISIFWRIIDTYIYTYKSQELSNEIFKDYAREIFSKIISYPVSFFKEQPLGRMTYSLNTGIKTLSGAVTQSMESLGTPAMILFNLIFLFYLSWRVGVIVLFGGLLYAIWLKFTIEKRKKVTKNFNNSKKDVNSKITESLNFAIEIKRNIKEKDEYKNLKSLMGGNYQKRFKEKIIFNVFNNSVSKIIFLLITISSLFIMIYEYRNGRLTEGAVLSIFSYTQSIMWQVRWFVNFLNQYIESFTLIGDTEKLLLHTPENYTKGKKSKKEILGEIEFKDVDFEYKEEKENLHAPGERAKQDDPGGRLKKKFSLKNINLKIEQGQKVAFVGESGGGKSTSIELVGGFYFPNKGDILIDGISTKDWNLNKLRSSIAYVSQDISIFNTTIGENISYGALKKVSQKEIEKAAKLANIHDYIKKLPDSYKTKVGEKGLKLSGGQKQRIAIARAILRNPKILILDEPTSALDIKSETFITESLKELMKGRTTIIIAHRISTIRDADKIYVFYKGEIVESGSYDKLKKDKGKFAKMIELSDGLR